MWGSVGSQGAQPLFILSAYYKKEKLNNMSILQNNYPNVNGNATTFSQGFTSTTIPTSSRSLHEPLSNVDAAAGKIIPYTNTNTNKNMNGGKSRRNRNKISSLYRRMKSTRHYKKKHRTTKSRRSAKKSKSTHTHKRRRHMRGGQQYKQFMSNVAYTPSYSLGGNLSADMSALANPAPYTILNRC